ncbi:MAG: NAD(P)-dependent alcohol dehydrogenase [Woeseiaceae bacterium]|jgi:NADPH:quinone reductase-like Zn-dependent oxidoreductase
MKLRYKILNSFLAVVVIVVGAFAFVLSRTEPCEPAPAIAPGTETMKAIVYRCYGSPDVLTFEEVEKPTPASEEVLVRVHAAAVNPYDWHYMRGSPYLMRLGSGLGSPKDIRLGADFAGTVVAVGDLVTEFTVGDEVFGGAAGAYAEYVTASPKRIARKPANVSFAEAASLPIAAITALQALRDHGALKSGDKVLINGASGGVGTFAVQIAKSMGAEVYGVCSTRNVDMVLALGADRVFDYKKEDYTQSGEQFDVIVDMIGNHSLLANRSVMAPDGRFVIVGGAKGNWIGPLIAPLKAMFVNPFVDQQMGMMIATMEGEDLAVLADLMERGELVSRIDRRYSLDETADAIRYSEEGHARGKIIIDLE